jgi:anti-sigma regulatory factor (Ser/Thr protein kinase)
VRLAASPSAPRRARAHVREALAGALSGEALDDAVLLTSELVTNAVVHAGLTAADVIGVDVGAAGERLRVSVSDPGPCFAPEPPARPPRAPGGRGLYLLALLADRWGVRAGPPCVVWFEVGRSSQPGG